MALRSNSRRQLRITIPRTAGPSRTTSHADLAAALQHAHSEAATSGAGREAEADRAALAELRRQLADVAAALLGAGAPAADAVTGITFLVQRAQRLEAELACSRAEVEGAATASRVAAAAVSRAVARAEWEAECAALARRAEQALAMGEAMLRQRSVQAAPDPYRAQLLGRLLSLGCAALGAATTISIIRHVHAG